jgi:NhaP-type Na+/H+ or K+/H+ antiporter
MLACASCGSTNAPGVPRCAKCGASMAGAGTALAKENADDDAVLRELAEKDRLKRRRIGHAITGILTFFLINLLFGLPGSLHPLNLLSNAIASAIFGAPIGYLISRFNAGPMKGAMISSATFLVVLVILSLLSGEKPGAVGFIAAVAAGAVPGYLIGFHVSSDT